MGKESRERERERESAHLAVFQMTLGRWKAREEEEEEKEANWVRASGVLQCDMSGDQGYIEGRGKHFGGGTPCEVSTALTR